MKNLAAALKSIVIFTLLTGIIYPIVITGITRLLFPSQADGSLIRSGNRITGSVFLGQQFDSLKYFSSRPSAGNYNTLPSGGSNYSMTSAKLKDLVNRRRDSFLSVNNLDSLTTVPAEMLFASASGLDPHISPEAACMQIDRIARIRNFNDNQKAMLVQLVKNQTEPPQLLCLGKERVNVLLLNLGVDRIK